jgi:hypothetical protein
VTGRCDGSRPPWRPLSPPGWRPAPRRRPGRRPSLLGGPRKTSGRRRAVGAP